jgi:hypothetical protein
VRAGVLTTVEAAVILRRRALVVVIAIYRRSRSAGSGDGGGGACVLVAAAAVGGHDREGRQLFGGYCDLDLALDAVAEGLRNGSRRTKPKASWPPYQAGATVYELSQRFGVSRQAASKFLHRHGVAMGMTGLTGEQIDEAIQLYESGWTLAKIGKHLQVSPDTVRLRPIERGVPMRPRGC